jgi:EpsI family protein
MFRIVAAGVASALVIVVGIVHGNWTDRWRTPPEPAAAAARFASIPTSLGEWEGQDVEQKGPVDPMLAGTLHRVYTNRHGQKVEVFLVCGRFDAVAIHPPEACYTASGFRLGARTKVPALGSKGDFWTADATRTKAAEETKVRLYWAWSTGQAWTPSDDARLTFARAPVLHKLYILRELDVFDEGKAEPCAELMQLLLPELDRLLFNPGS